MAPALKELIPRREMTGGAEKPHTPNGLVLEGWAQGFLVGSLVIMAAITIANMRKGVLLHKLILIELLLGILHPTFIFMNPPVYGWYLSSTAILLNMSWSLHNVIAWLKTRPFLSKRWSIFYISTVIIAQPYWVLEIYANFTFFNNINDLFRYTRPYEAIFRDPWWLISIIILLYQIHITYKLPLQTIIRLSPRFGVLFVAMILSVCFIILDILAVTTDIFSSTLPDGLNPFWKLAMTFKCLTDVIILDDFKTALDRLMRYKMRRELFNAPHSSFAATTGPDEEAEMGSSLRRRETADLDPLSEEAQERSASVPLEGDAIDFETALHPTMTARSDRIQRIKAMAMAKHIDSWDDIDLPEFQSSSLGGSSIPSSKDSRDSKVS